MTRRQLAKQEEEFSRSLRSRAAPQQLVAEDTEETTAGAQEDLTVDAQETPTLKVQEEPDAEVEGHHHGKGTKYDSLLPPF